MSPLLCCGPSSRGHGFLLLDSKLDSQHVENFPDSFLKPEVP